MTQISIQRGIKIPQYVGKRSPVLDAMARVKVGESFAIPATAKDHNFYHKANRLEIKIKTRKVTERGVKKIRIWRVE